MHHLARLCQLLPSLIVAFVVVSPASAEPNELVLRVEIVRWTGSHEGAQLDRARATSCELLCCAEAKSINDEFSSKSIINDQCVKLSGKLQRTTDGLFVVNFSFHFSDSDGTAEAQSTVSMRIGELIEAGSICSRRILEEKPGIRSHKFVDKLVYISVRRAGEMAPEVPQAGTRYREQRALERLEEVGAGISQAGRIVSLDKDWSGTGEDLLQLKYLTRLVHICVTAGESSADDVSILRAQLPDVTIEVSAPGS